MKSTIACPLCLGDSSAFYDGFNRCNSCEGIFRLPAQKPDKNIELTRYLAHNNDVFDAGYRAFSKPLVDAVLRNQTAIQKGLDFGSGAQSALWQMLFENGYVLSKFDPYFHPQKEVLNTCYDYIVACEVIEHFFNPLEGFKNIFDCLEKGGRLYAYTDIYLAQDFKKWYYKNDPTHCFFYTHKSLQWIKNQFSLQRLDINLRLITFIK